MSNKKQSKKSIEDKLACILNTEEYNKQLSDIKTKSFSNSKTKNTKKEDSRIKEDNNTQNTNKTPLLKPIFVRSVNNFPDKLEASQKYNKETRDRKIEVRKLLSTNKQASLFYKILFALQKIHSKSDAPSFLINQRLFMNLSRILNISVTDELLSQLLDFIDQPDLINKQGTNSLEINRKKYDQYLFNQKIDEIFIEKLTEKYKKTLKEIEVKTKIEQEKFEFELKKKNINLRENCFILNSTIEKNKVTKTVKERMSAILLKLQNKKLKRIESFSDNSLIKNIKYIFEVENKTRLSLNFINEKLQIQDSLHSPLTLESINLMFKNNEEFKILEMYNEIFIERFKRGK